MKSIRSTAGHVLSTGRTTDEEAKALAASVLGDEVQPRSARSLADLRALLQNVKGREGQVERVAAIEAEIRDRES